MTTGKYFATDSEEAVERERLGLLESVLDPQTRRHIGALGIAKGWKCLEVAGGAGSVARWLAEQVGPEGRVIATDINPRLLRDLDLPNLSVRQHDITSDGLEEAEYDLVHCRHVLGHIAGREKALERMAAAVCPGGWLLVEEFDTGLWGAADPRHPSASFFDQCVRALSGFSRETGMADPYFGRRVRALVEGLGFKEVDHEAFLWQFRGGDLMAKFMYLSSQVARPGLVAAGLFTEQEYDHIMRLYQDPSFPIVHDVTLAVWGRRAG